MKLHSKRTRSDQGDWSKNWLNKPDGSPGWVDYFLAQGYECYILDQPGRGRSPYLPGSGNLGVYSVEYIQDHFTAAKHQKLWPQASLHTQWPGSGIKGDLYFDSYYASCVASLSSATDQQTRTQSAGALLLDRIGKPVIVVGHSQGGIMAWLVADARPQLVRAIISLEPTGPPFIQAIFSSQPARVYGLTDIPISYDPPVSNPCQDLAKQKIEDMAIEGLDVACIIQATNPPPRQLTCLRNIPVLLVTAEASYHAIYDWCTVKYLKQAGVAVEHMDLAKEGVHGNGHMMFLEKNSDEIAGLLHKWLTSLT